MEGASLARMRGWCAAMLVRMGAGLVAFCALVAAPATAKTTAFAESQAAIPEQL